VTSISIYSTSEELLSLSKLISSANLQADHLLHVQI
jgi:hypothetical protein